MIFLLTRLVQRELRIAWRKPQAIFQPILFFSLTICLFPLAIGTDNASLQHSAPAILWIALFLSVILAADSLFAEDYHDGTLAQDRMHLDPLWLLVFAKAFSAWLRFTLPLLILLPLITLMLHIPAHNLPWIALLLTLGSFVLLMIGTIGAALTLSQLQSTFLLFLIVVPLYIPVLIIGVTATRDSLLGLSIHGPLALLGAFVLFSVITIIPFSTLALRSQPLP